MFRVAHNAGRLVEVRTVSPLSSDEIAQAEVSMVDAVHVARQAVVVCADYRKLTVLPARQADEFVAMFRRHNLNIEVSAIIVAPTSAIAVLQIERVISEADCPNRKCFRSTSKAIDWLRPHLSPSEDLRLRAFLATDDDR